MNVGEGYNLIAAVTSADRTASGDSGELDGYGLATAIRAQLVVTARSGTNPTLDAVIEDSLDGGTTWSSLGSFTQKTATGSEAINIIAPIGPALRVRWTIGGTNPHFTFYVNLVAK